MQTSHYTIDLDAGVDIETRAKNWRAALVEARMRRYWAQRDVQTVGA